MSFKVIKFEKVPSYEEFLHQVLIPNNACVIAPALIDSWPIYEWLQKASLDSMPSSSASLDPAFDLLAKEFPEHQVPVVISQSPQNHKDEGYEGDETERNDMSLQDAIELMKYHASRRADGDGKLVYIKDWHLVREERLRALASTTAATRQSLSLRNKWYGTPDIFKDDWMNNDGLTDCASETINDEQQETQHPTETIPDDFRFCYAGMKDTTTGLHRDVYGSYSWSTNLIGSKEWCLYDPSDAPFLLQYTDKPSAARSAADHREYNSLPHTTLQQRTGWTIFVPSNCFHTVRNVEDTISINQNWCNSMCIERMYEGLKVDMDRTRDALGDVEEMMRDGAKYSLDIEKDKLEQQESSWQVEFWKTVQLVNKSNTGWDWEAFWTMVCHALERPPCSPSLHPPLTPFVYPLTLRLAHDFTQLQYYPWLCASTDLEAVIARCRAICSTKDNQ